MSLKTPNEQTNRETATGAVLDAVPGSAAGPETAVRSWLRSVARTEPAAGAGAGSTAIAEAAPNDGIYFAQPRHVNSILKCVREAMLEYARDSGIPTDEDGIPLLDSLHEGPDQILAAIQHRQILVARRNWKIVGTARLDMDLTASICYLRRYAVIPGQQNNGIGRLLFERAAEEARKAGLRELRLITSSAHHRLLSYYRHLGFEVIAIDETGPYSRTLLAFQL